MKKRKGKNWLAALPIYLFTLIFVALPLVYVVVISFFEREAVWGVSNRFTLANYVRILDPTYLKVFWDSIKLAAATTVLTMFVGYPFGYFTARLPKKKRGIVLLLVIAPFWTNALVRIYGWMILMRTGGPINGVIIGLGFSDEPVKMLYTYGAVLVGMVYALLPYMILPVYTSAEKLDRTLVEASRDLGAGPIKSFFTVTLPLTMPGVMSGCVLVFVPSIGLFFLSDLLGGSKLMLVGNLIKNEMLTSRDWPFGAALAIVMLAMMMVFLGIYRRATGNRELEGGF